MALKQADQIRYDAIATMINTLKNLDHDYHTVLGAVAPQIADFEKSTGQAVRIKSNFEIELIDRRKDFLRVRSPNSESKVLRTKVDGVAIDVKIFKEGDYDFDNETIASSLRRLAEEVSGISKSLVEFPDCEVKAHLEEIGESSVEDSQAEEAEESEGELEEAQEETSGDSIQGSEASAHPDQYAADGEESEVARMEAEEAPEGHYEGSGFRFEEPSGSMLDEDEETESDRLFDQ